MLSMLRAPILVRVRNPFHRKMPQALAELTKQHGVDYQYVLENFCVLGTLEQAKQMVSERKSPPDNVPAGPRCDTPAGSPTSHPGRS
jgi:hypothetical protein